MNYLVMLFVLVTVAGCGGSAGKDGLNGAQGPAGANGANGTNGAAGLTMSSITQCSKTSGAYLFVYRVSVYSTGDKFIECEVGTQSTNNSASGMYRAGTGGATTESCYVTADVDAASGGYWTFVNSAGTRKTTYTDAGSASNGTVVTYAPADCTTN